MKSSDAKMTLFNLVSSLWTLRYCSSISYRTLFPLHQTFAALHRQGPVLSLEIQDTGPAFKGCIIQLEAYFKTNSKAISLAIPR